MHTPMAQRGLRGSPATDLRVAAPACTSAAATLVPSATDTGVPLMVSVSVGFAICVEIDRPIEVPRDVDCNVFCILRKKQENTVQASMTAVTASRKIEVTDSHTAGEPTRCVLSGGPDLGQGSLQERMARLRGEHDWMRRAVLCEPRGSDVIVGAWLLEPDTPDCIAAVVF